MSDLTVNSDWPCDREAEAAARRQSAQRTVVFSADTLDALAGDAEKRGISINELARRIVDSVVEDNIIDAVLDDLNCEAA